MSFLTSLFSPKTPKSTGSTMAQDVSSARDEAARKRQQIAANNAQQGLAGGGAQGLLGPTPVNRPTLKRTLGQ